MTVQLFVAQVVPEESLRVCLVLAEGFGVLQGLLAVLTFDDPPPARRRAGALVLPTPPQGGSDSCVGWGIGLGFCEVLLTKRKMGVVALQGGFCMDGVEIDEPGFEQRPRHRFQGLVHAPVQIDLVVQRAQDVGDGTLGC